MKDKQKKCIKQQNKKSIKHEMRKWKFINIKGQNKNNIMHILRTKSALSFYYYYYYYYYYYFMRFHVNYMCNFLFQKDFHVMLFSFFSFSKKDFGFYLFTLKLGFIMYFYFCPKYKKTLEIWSIANIALSLSIYIYLYNLTIDIESN